MVNVGPRGSARRKSASPDPGGSEKEKGRAARPHSRRSSLASLAAVQGAGSDWESLWNSASLSVAVATASSSSASSSSSSSPRSSRSLSRSPRASWLAVPSAGNQTLVRKAPGPKGNPRECASLRSF